MTLVNTMHQNINNNIDMNLYQTYILVHTPTLHPTPNAAACSGDW